MEGRYVIGYDVGTGGCKAVLASLTGELVASEFEPYGIDHPADHCAEQDPADWWRAVATTTRRLMRANAVDPGDVACLAFASQMLGVLPVDEEGAPLRPGIIWMDCRAESQARRIVRRLGGRRVIMSLVGAVPSGKDVMCKIKWLEENEPDVFERTRAFLDVKGYIVQKATGSFEADQTVASVTGLMDKRTRDYSPLVARILGASLEKMPTVKKCADIAGSLKVRAAEEMGLREGTPVASGMGDAPASALGGGALAHGESLISIGTSGLLMITVSRRVNLGRNGMVSIANADPGMWLLTGEMNTAGACLKWFAEQLAGREEVARATSERRSVYEVLDEVVGELPAGARKLIFTPWMYGERAPITDTALRGAFVNVGLDHTRGDMLRAVYEGVALNFRWQLEAAAKKGLPCRTVRVIGGGARSDSWMQIFADATGRTMEAVENEQDICAFGAALSSLLAIGIYGDYGDLRRAVRVRRTFEPDPGNRGVYDEAFASLKTLYGRLAPVYHDLNSVT